MNGLRIGSVCSGIGGLELGLERAGLGRTAWQVEIDPKRRAILRRHWPEARQWDDLWTFPGWPADLLCGGFPCQPESKAGKGLSDKDPRWLWPAFARTIGVVRPRVVVMENVERILGRPTMGRVLGDLAALGYDAEWDCVPAQAVGAPHPRDRWFLLAYSDEVRRLHWQPGVVAAEEEQPALALSLSGGETTAVSNRDEEGLDRAALRQRWVPPSARGHRWDPEPDVARVVHGVSTQLDRDRIEQLGDSVVPAVAEHVGRILRARLGGAP